MKLMSQKLKLKNRFIPVNTPKIFSQERKLVNKALTTGWISSEGPAVKQFEKKFSNFNKRKFGITVTSGTAALEIIIKSLKNRKWRLLKKLSEIEAIKFRYKSITVNFKWNSFEEILIKSNFVISMAGTASEQAIGLAKPVVQIEGKGPQFTKSFAEAQRRLLGKYVFCATDFKNKKDQISKTVNLIIKVIYNIKLNKQFLSSCIQNAKLRLGDSKSTNRIIEDLLFSHRL